MKSKNMMVSLDADHQGHLLVVICEYLNYIRLNPEKFLESDDTDSRCAMAIEVADTFYLAGNIEGRCLCNQLTVVDVELLDLWEDELNRYKDADLAETSEHE